MPATNFFTDKRRSSRKRFRMGHRHDDNSNGGNNEIRHLENPYDDWNETLNERLLMKIEAEHPLHESIEEEQEDSELNEYYNFKVPTSQQDRKSVV